MCMFLSTTLNFLSVLLWYVKPCVSFFFSASVIDMYFSVASGCILTWLFLSIFIVYWFFAISSSRDFREMIFSTPSMKIGGTYHI